MTFRKELNIQDRLFILSEINQDALLYILSKKGTILHLQEIGENPDINLKKKQKIFETIAELCEKGYAKERSDNKSVSITIRGHWYRIIHNQTYQFIAATVTIISFVIFIWPSNKSNVVNKENDLQKKMGTSG